MEADTATQDNIVATGSRSELELMKSKLQGTNFVPRGKKLEIRNNKLIFVRARVTKKQTVNKAKKDILQAVKDNRKILNNEQLSEQQIDFILNKVIDAKLMGITLNVEDEVARITKPQRPKHKPERRRAKKKRFKVLPPPTAVEETETDINHTDWGQSDYISESE